MCLNLLQNVCQDKIPESDAKFSRTCAISPTRSGADQIPGDFFDDLFRYDLAIFISSITVTGITDNSKISNHSDGRRVAASKTFWVQGIVMMPNCRSTENATAPNNQWFEKTPSSGIV